MDKIHATAFLGPNQVRDRWLSDDARPLRSASSKYSKRTTFGLNHTANPPKAPPNILERSISTDPSGKVHRVKAKLTDRLKQSVAVILRVLAKTLGLTVPPALLARTDDTIE